MWRLFAVLTCVIASCVIAPSTNAKVISEGGASQPIKVHHRVATHAMPINVGIKATPTPSPAPPPSYASSFLSAGAVADYARQAGFPEVLIPTMVAIAYRESHFNPRAVNSSSGACGLWQLYPCISQTYLQPQANAWGARQKCLASIAAGSDCLRPWGL